MKVLFAIKALSGITGGAERVLCVVTSELAARGHDVTIVSFDHTQSAPFYTLSPIVKRKILGTFDPVHKSTLPEILSRMIALRKFVQAEKPDVVVGFMHSIFVPLAISLVGSGIPMIASEHIVPQYYRFRRLEFLALIVSGFFTKGITVLSAPVKKLYPSFLQKRMFVVPNPVSSFPKPESSVKQKIVLNVGRLDPQKDQKTLIEAFAKLSPTYPDWTLRIIGEGPLRIDLETQIKTLGLTDKIFLPGKNSHIENEYSKAEIFAIPSLYESFGLATAEAMLFNLPAIGFSDCPGTNEIIIDGVNGILVDPGNRAESLKSGLEKLMSSENLRRTLGEHGPETIKKYEPEAIASIWEKILAQAL